MSLMTVYNSAHVVYRPSLLCRAVHELCVGDAV
jgi:hypothetical protein